MNYVKQSLAIISFFWVTISLCWAQTNKLENTGNVGIGTMTPTVPLEIRKVAQTGFENFMKFSVSDAPDDFFTVENGTIANDQFIPLIRGTRSSDNRYALIISGSIATGMVDTGDDAVVAFDARLANGKVNHRPLFVWQNHTTRYMTMLSDGSVGIGTTNPQAKLAVNGNILATEVKVKTNIAVPDYVFEPDYELSTLKEVEAYVKKHKHLPEIPSAADIQRDGMDLAEMNLLLLKKVEELTLYLIAKEKSEQTIKEELQATKQDVQELKNLIKEIKATQP